MSQIRGSGFFAEGEDSEKTVSGRLKEEQTGHEGSSDLSLLASFPGCGCCLHEQG